MSSAGDGMQRKAVEGVQPRGKESGEMRKEVQEESLKDDGGSISGLPLSMDRGLRKAK